MASAELPAATAVAWLKSKSCIFARCMAPPLLEAHVIAHASVIKV
jgi:hypothetical protein